jgi:hypothetical protein
MVTAWLTVYNLDNEAQKWKEETWTDLSDQFFLHFFVKSGVFIY